MGDKTVSVIGLGAMGLPMAQCLVRDGFTVTGFDLNETSLATLEKSGGRAAGSAAEAAGASPVVLVMVVNAEQAEAVLFDGEGLNGLKDGQTVVASCTMAPERARAIGARLAEHGVAMLDAPVSGGTVGATAGTLAVMAAGPDTAFEAARPVLESVGGHVYRIGDAHGQGSAMKLVNQLLCGVHIVAAAEAMALGAEAGIDKETLFEVICNAAGASWMFGNRGPRMMEDDPEVSSAVDIFVKDVGIVLDFGRAARFPLPLAAQAHQMFLAASHAGLGRADDSQVIRVYEKMTGAKPD